MYKVSEIRINLKNKKQAVKVFCIVYPILSIGQNISIYNGHYVKIDNITVHSSAAGHNKTALKLVDFIKSIKKINIISLNIDTKKYLI